MLEMFLQPFSLAAGGILVASPIIIHLINRMRFKRIRWAAMEFLLKSQKRNRRKLIIEQILLLVLRVLLVILIAFILSRFVGCEFTFAPQNRQHVVILDDTPSMGDQWREEDETRTSFKSAKKLIVEEIAKHAAQASKAQQFKVIRTTQPNDVLFNQRLNDATIRDLGSVLAGIEKESPLHVDLIHSVRQARKLFDETPQDARVLYIVSDFRDSDWKEPEGKALLDELSAMAKLGVFVKFVDVAHPARKDGESEPRYHENLAIVRLMPDAKVIAQEWHANFTAVVANHSPRDAKNVKVNVRLNGQDRAGNAVVIPVVRANSTAEARISMYLDETGPNLVSAYIDPEETGLNIDNSRHAVVEVRKRVPILLIDGDNTARPRSDRWYAEYALFGSEEKRQRGVIPGYDIVAGGVAKLEEPDLDRYPSIYLCNVRELSDKALQNLDSYVREGGSVAFFLGDRVNPEFYNKRLWADGQGLFPAPLADRFSAELTKDEVQDREEIRRTNDAPYYVILRNERHPAFKELLEGGETGRIHPYFSVVFRYDADIDRHFPIARARWNQQPGRVEELASLPNTKSTDDFKDGIQRLLARLPVDDAKYKEYSGRLGFYRNSIRDLLANKLPLYKVASQLDKLLHEDVDSRDPEKSSNLKLFWTAPELAGLKGDLERTLDAVKFGDPLLVEGRYGKGRVLVCTTTLGEKWNNLAGQQFFPLFIGSVHRYLTSVNKDAELIVGNPLDIYLDQTRYDTKMRRFRRPETGDAAGVKPAAKGANLIPLGEQQQVGTPVNGRIHFRFTDAQEPGMYVLEFYPASGAPAGAKPEQRAFAYNIDTAAESNLLRYRISRDDLERTVPNSRLYSLGADKFSDLSEQKGDLSEKPWLFLAFLGLLVAEQALAVHLSFHLHGGAAPGTPGRPETAPA